MFPGKSKTTRTSAALRGKCPNMKFFSGPSFPVIGLNADQKKLHVWTLFTQCRLGIKKLLRCKISHKTFDFNLQTPPNSKITFFLFILLVLTKAAQYLLTYKSSH